MICVVEEPADVIPIERTHEYRGLYHVLGGALSPIDGIDPDDLRSPSWCGGSRPAGSRRSCSRPTRRRPARRPHSTSPSFCAARPASPGWPAASRSGPTSSTPMRSPSARPSRAAAVSEQRSPGSDESPGRVSTHFSAARPLLASGSSEKVRGWSRSHPVGAESGEPVRQLAREVSTMQVELLRRLESELESGDVETFATAARELAEAFGSVSATAIGAVADVSRRASHPGTLHRRCAAGSTSCSRCTVATGIRSGWW